MKKRKDTKARSMGPKGRPCVSEENQRKQLIRAAHAAARAAGIDEDTRRALQFVVTGKSSMRDMGVDDLKRLVARLNHDRPAARRSDSRSDAVKSGNGKPPRSNRLGWRPPAPRGDLRLVHALWTELGRRGAIRRPGRDGLNAFIRRRFGEHWSFVPMDVDALTDTNNITDVVRALKAMLERTDDGGDGDGGDGDGGKDAS